jgi:serine O-acetyltransferase
LPRVLRACTFVLMCAARGAPSLIVRLWLRDFWTLRGRLLRSKGQGRELLKTAYYAYMEKEKFFIGSNAVIASKPVFPHGMVGIFISEGARLGSGCTLYPYAAIGSNTFRGSRDRGAPVIGDNCYIGIGATIIGGITVGDNCRVGANCTVTENIPGNSVVVSQKPRIIRKDMLDNTWDPY